MAANTPITTRDRIPGSAPALRRGIGLRDLVLFNIAAVIGLRWVSAAAHAGPGSLTLWMVAAVLFFVPSALVVASLSRRFPQEGGLYIWTREAFGPWHGFLCGWMYVLSNLVFFPALLLAGVSIAAWVFGSAGPHLAESRAWTLPIAFAALWIAAITNLFGIDTGKWTGNVGAVSNYAVMLLLIAVAAATLRHHAPATQFHLAPDLSFSTVNLWSQIAFAYVGLELGAILAGEMHDPRRNIPRAAWISGIACAAFYIAGTASLLVLMRPTDISELSGLGQAGAAAGARLHAAWLPPLFAALVAAGITGQLGSFLAGNTRLPFAIGLDHYLPAAFARLHPRWRTPHVSILVQAVAASLFLLAAQLGETARAAYQILVDMSVITAFIPYVYIFGAAIRFGQPLAGALGLLISVLAIVLSAVPPPEVASVAVFEAKVVGGCAALALLGRIIFVRQKAHA